MRYDADSSGDIDAGELFRALNDLGLASSSAEATLVLDKYDADSSRKLELPEFRQLIADLRSYQSKSDDETGRVFRRFDLDHSGAIEANELSAALYALGLHTDASETRAILRKYDADDNRALDAGEFRKLVADLRAYQFRRAEGGGYRDDDAVHATFVRYDRNNSNSIDNAELRHVLGALGLSTTGAQAEAVLRRYDRDRSGRLELPEFRELVFMLRRYQTGSGAVAAGSLEPSVYTHPPGVHTHPPSNITPPAAPPPPEPPAAAPPAVYATGAPPPPPPAVAAVDAAAAADPVLMATGETVGQVFRRFDTDGSGDIDASELKHALNALGLESDGAAAQAVLSKFDSSGDGKLQLAEFRAMVKELKKYQQAGGGGAAAMPPTAAPPPVSDPAHVLRIFKQYDRDNSNDIDLSELRLALNALGLYVDTAAAEDVLRRFDTSNKGTLNFDEFRRVVEKLAAFQSGTATRGD